MIDVFTQANVAWRGLWSLHGLMGGAYGRDGEDFSLCLMYAAMVLEFFTLVRRVSGWVGVFLCKFSWLKRAFGRVGWARELLGGLERRLFWRKFAVDSSNRYLC